MSALSRIRRRRIRFAMRRWRDHSHLSDQDAFFLCPFCDTHVSWFDPTTGERNWDALEADRGRDRIERCRYAIAHASMRREFDRAAGQ